MSNIHETLAERGKRYGNFDEHANITQTLKGVMADTPKWDAMADDQKEALEMIAHKIGRILNGDPNYDDSWRDIVGYAQLVLDRLTKWNAGNAAQAGAPISRREEDRQISGGIRFVFIDESGEV